MKNSRFKKIAAELLNLKNCCPDCGTSMKIQEISCTIILLYCSECNMFRMKGRNYEQDTRTKKDSIV